MVRKRYESGLRSVERGDLDTLLRQFHPSCEMTFVGDTSLGADRLRGTDLRRWFERFLRLIPNRRFEVRTFISAGPMWRRSVAAHVLIHGDIAGFPYTNQFAHFLVLRWGRVVTDLVLEDTQQWERACRRLVDSGVPEAGAPPITA